MPLRIGYLIPFGDLLQKGRGKKMIGGPKLVVEEEEVGHDELARSSHSEPQRRLMMRSYVLVIHTRSIMHTWSGQDRGIVPRGSYIVCSAVQCAQKAQRR